ncbi:MAG TPA: M23 family metallopeptidase [Acidimicrobiia bacterium]|nr:M23 family metallopeptidase [Acidimicrobiia bacterium]
MHSRVLMRSLALVTVVVVGFGGLTPTMSADARTDPPFEIVFPQEASLTEFHDTYGQSRSGGRSHKGIDLLAPRMTEVYAAAAGVVVYVGTNNLSGRNLRISHGGGWESHYVHLNNDNLGTDDGQAPWTLTVAPGIEQGERVEAGQLIAWVGDSGNAESTTPHTHFELRHDDTPINAYSLLIVAYEKALEAEAFPYLGGVGTYGIE